MVGLSEEVYGKTINYSADYRRTTGVHSAVDSIGDKFQILSFHTWDELWGALEDASDFCGEIVTPECCTFTDRLANLTDDDSLVRERNELVLDWSRGSQARVWLGTLALDEAGNWRNQLQVIRNGQIVTTMDKSLLSLYEMDYSPVVSGQRGNRQSIDGISAAICSETFTSHRKFFAGLPRTVLVPACLAVVNEDAEWQEARKQWIEQMGGVDNYFRIALERAVSRIFFNDSVETVIVADASPVTSGIDGPLNAVYRKTQV